MHSLGFIFVLLSFFIITLDIIGVKFIDYIKGR